MEGMGWEERREREGRGGKGDATQRKFLDLPLITSSSLHAYEAVCGTFAEMVAESSTGVVFTTQ